MFRLRSRQAAPDSDPVQSIEEAMATTPPSPGEYLSLLNPRLVDERVARYDNSTPRRGQEL